MNFFKSIFHQAPDIVFYEFTIYNGRDACLIYCEDIVDSQHIDSHVLEPLTKARMTKILSKHIEAEMTSVLDTLQHQYHTDPVGLMDGVYRRYPRWWHSVQNDWREAYSQLPVQIEVDVNVRRTGLTTSNW